MLFMNWVDSMSHSESVTLPQSLLNLSIHWNTFLCIMQFSSYNANPLVKEVESQNVAEHWWIPNAEHVYSMIA
jgi:hypothetical protein